MRNLTLTSDEPILGYTISERIGTGGYGEVWRASAPGGLTKAIKFVYGFLDDERASRELKALNRVKEVRHPFLLSLERIEVVDGQLVIVTELAEMSLKERFDECKVEGLSGIPREELLVYLRDTADALDFMNEKHALQHLDVKPENLLLLGGRVKVADFGLVKDIEATNVSLMGGLTPVYASPESFDDQPSRHSDQYSLAIVYQEMLTGVLPFPGTTAAQLAVQHLQSRPRLAGLPLSDQAVVARALAKKPEERFASCKEFVDTLLSAGQVAASPPAAPNTAPEDVSSASRSDPNARTEIQHGAGGTPDLQHNTAIRSTNLRSEASPAHMATEVMPGSAVPSVRPTEIVGNMVRPDVVDVDGFSPEEFSIGFRPTLVLGVGGTAGRVLQQLRHRLEEHFGDPQKLPALRTLLIDTDQKSMLKFARGPEGKGLAPEDLIATPLRRPQDYRSDTQKFFSWLSRRWLYNIPKSLQTEGLRPLGRLALIDHAHIVVDRLQKSLRQLSNPESIQATSQSLGLEVRDECPRIVLLGSIAGGTGSGMIPDLAFLARDLLVKAGLSKADVATLLLHSTNRRTTGKDLASANAYACLEELHHYLYGGGHPGEPALGLSALPAAAEFFGDDYLVHLGDGLNDELLNSAANNVATYLYLDVTCGGGYFERCRNDAVQPGKGMERASLRSFGTSEFGGSCPQATALMAESLASHVVRHWTETPRSTTVLGGKKRGEEANSDPKEGSTSSTEEKSPLSVESFFEGVLSPLDEELQPMLTAEPHKITLACAKEVESWLRERYGGEENWELLRKGIITLNTAFSPGSEIANLEIEFVTDLQQRMVDHFGERISRWKNEIRELLHTVMNTPGRRFTAAQKLIEKLSEASELQDTLLAEKLAQIQHTIKEFVAAIPTGVTDKKKKNTLAAYNLEISQLTECLAFYLQRKVHESLLLKARKSFHTMGSNLTAERDRVSDLRHELSQIGKEFRAPASWDSVLADYEQQDDGAAWVASRAIHEFEKNRSEFSARMDQELQEQYMQPAEGIEHLGAHGQEARDAFIDAARQMAGRLVSEIFQSIDVVEAVVASSEPDQEEEEPADGPVIDLKQLVQAANPSLLFSGGIRRLLLVTPQQAAEDRLREALVAATGGVEPTHIASNQSHFTICWEAEQLPLAPIAASLVNGRDDYIQAAARLRTRSDVEWQKLQEPCAT